MLHDLSSRNKISKQHILSAQSLDINKNTESESTTHHEIYGDHKTNALQEYVPANNENKIENNSHLNERHANETNDGIDGISSDTVSNIILESVPTISQTHDSDWLLVDDGISKFYFNKITKECSFEPQNIKNEITSNDSKDVLPDIKLIKAITTQADSATLMEWILRKKNSIMIEKVEDFEIYMDFQFNKPFYLNVTLFFKFYFFTFYM